MYLCKNILVKMPNYLFAYVYPLVLVLHHFPLQEIWRKKYTHIYCWARNGGTASLFLFVCVHVNIILSACSYKCPTVCQGLAVTLQHCRLIFSCSKGPEKTVLRLGHLCLECVILVFLQRLQVAGTLFKANDHVSLLKVTL